LWRRKTPEGWANLLCITSDGRCVVGAGSGFIRRWSTNTGKEIGSLLLPPQYSILTLMPGGERLIAIRRENRPPGTDLCQLDVETGKELGTFGKINSLAVLPHCSPDGKIVVTWEPSTITLWNAVTLAPLRTIEERMLRPRTFAFSPDGATMVISGSDSQLREVATGKFLRSLEGHPHSLYSLAFSPDGARLFACTPELTIRSWDVKTGQQIPFGPGHSGYLRDLCFSPDGKSLLTAGHDPIIRLWDVSTGKEVRQFQGNEGTIYNAVAFSKDGKTVAAGGSDDVILVWDVPTDRPLQRLEGPKDKHVHSLAFGHDGRTLFAAGYEKAVRRWDLVTGKQLPAIDSHEMNIRCLRISPDGRVLLGAGSGDQEGGGQRRLVQARTPDEQGRTRG
jgi:WD40 repeat protein